MIESRILLQRKLKEIANNILGLAKGRDRLIKVETYWEKLYMKNRTKLLADCRLGKLSLFATLLACFAVAPTAMAAPKTINWNH